MSYTMSDVKEADRLYDQMPLYKVAEKMEISLATLSRWKGQGLIFTDKKHRSDYSAQDISRADELYDLMPLSEIAEVMDVPLGTLGTWRTRGWISTDVNWRSESNGATKKASPRRAVELVHEQGLTQKEAADRLGVHRTTVGEYIRQYRNGEL